MIVQCITLRFLNSEREITKMTMNSEIKDFSDLTVIVPTLNEEESISALLSEIEKMFQRLM
jgi:hypothetical protein